MDDETFKTELLARLEKIQSLLSYLCAAAKANEERAQARILSERRAQTELADAQKSRDAIDRLQLQDEMNEDYAEALEKWKSRKGDPTNQGATP